MEQIRIVGGRRLTGTIPISGAKNAALPIMCAALLSARPLSLGNVPRLMDVSTMARLLGRMGVQVDRSVSAEGRDDGCQDLAEHRS